MAAYIRMHSHIDGEIEWIPYVHERDEAIWQGRVKAHGDLSVEPMNNCSIRRRGWPIEPHSEQSHRERCRDPTVFGKDSSFSFVGGKETPDQTESQKCIGVVAGRAREQLNHAGSSRRNAT